MRGESERGEAKQKEKKMNGEKRRRDTDGRSERQM